MNVLRRPPYRTVTLLGLLGFSLLAAAQTNPITISTTSPQKAWLRQPYRLKLEAQGGVPPFQWRVTSGELPSGIELGLDGVLSGAPTSAGEYRFVVTATDSAQPAFQRTAELVLRVIAPLEIKWDRVPVISGHRIEGAIKVSNQTEQDFDLTLVVLAVNEIGRATAIGYQRFTLKRDTIDLAIPFGENLPRGVYQVNADVVGEVEATNTIHRARLVTSKLQVQQGP